MRHFDVLRACFYLLAIVLLLEMVYSLIGGLLCFWMNYTGIHEVGACLPVVNIIREVFAEVLAAILALLLAAKGFPPDPPKE